jgi:hypothetical protein
MATKKRTARKIARKRVIRKKVSRKKATRKIVRKRASVRKKRKVSRSSSSSKIAAAKKLLIDNAKELLKEGLYLRDKASTLRGHKAAVKKIEKARRELRQLK